MEHSRTPAGYIIAIVAVLGSVWLMPPFPILILAIGPTCLLGLILLILLRRSGTRQQQTPTGQGNKHFNARKGKAA